MITFTKITQTGYFYKNTSSEQSINLCVLRDARIHELYLFCVFGGFYASGTQDTKITKSLPV